MTQTVTLRFIIVYYVLAMLFNIISITRVELGEVPLIDGNPVLSMVLLSLFLLLYALGRFQYQRAFLGLCVFAIILLPIQGIFPHIQALMSVDGLARYASIHVAWVALFINLFGACVVLSCFVTSPIIHVRNRHGIK